MKIVLYEKLDRAFLQQEVAARLSNCQDYLTKLNPTLHLLVYDAARPESVQWKMWNALDSIPAKERGKFISNPKHKSLHNFGAAVDLTICDSKGIALDMGAGFDDIREIAYPSLEAKFLASGELTKLQVENRNLLRQVMRHQKFRNLPTEWWHFNACTRAEASLIYQSVKEEF
jgi:D-alanyl-D-alanine dipeptidase